MPAVVAVFAAELLTAELVFAAVAQAGMAMSVAGAVTGNKDLMKVGAVMGIVGGVGGWAMGATEAGAAAGVGASAETATPEALDLFYGTDAASQTMGGEFGNWASTANVAAEGAGAIDPSAMSNAIGTENAGGLMQSSVSPAGQMSPDLAAQQAATPGVDGVVTPEIQTPGINGVATPSVQAPGVTGIPAPDISNLAEMTPQQVQATSIPELSKMAQSAIADASRTGVWDGFKAWYGKLSESQKLLVGQMGMGALQGAGAAYSKGQELDFMKDQFGAKQDELGRQIKNANTVVPIVYRPKGLMMSGGK